MTDASLWYTARGAGLAALLALTLSTSLGAAGSMKTSLHRTRFVVQYMHRTAAFVGLALIALHVTTIILDRKAYMGVADSFVPFASSYRPNSVALGSIAMYVIVLVIALGLARGRIASSPRGARMWRGLHLLALPAWLLAVLHGYLTGSDQRLGWVQLLNLGCIFAVVATVTIRFLRTRQSDTTPRAAPSALRMAQ